MVLALVVLPSVGFAATVQDRYGPPMAQREAPLAAAASVAPTQQARERAAAYHGPYLTWAGRTRAAAPIALQAPPPQPVPMASAPQPVRMANAAPYRPAPMAAAPLPTSLYDAPRAPAMRPATQPAAPTPRPQTPAAQAVIPAPARAAAPTLAAATPPMPPAPVQSAPPPLQVAVADTAGTPRSAPVRAKFYSLHREYGDTPDPVTLPPARPMVLIGPSADAPPPKTDGDSAAPKPSKPSTDSAY